MELQGYCLDWHKNVSHSFNQFLVEPLSSYFGIHLNSWNGIEISDPQSSDSPTIFCQFAPPNSWLGNKNAKIIWVPMWDGIPDKTQSWWNQLPKDNLRVISFSEQIKIKSTRAGIQTLDVKFFKNPETFNNVEWNNGRTLLYWNRRGLISPNLLNKLCSILEVDKLIFLSHIDPLVPESCRYSLPNIIGKTKVEEYTGILPQTEYLNLLAKSNIFISPRYLEGVGLTILEAMAQGSVVFSKNAPTMNEYIQHMKNGYLLQESRLFPTNVLLKMQRVINKQYINYWRKKMSLFIPLLPDVQRWKEIKQLDLLELGSSARETQYIGYKKWSESIKDMASFITDW